jgi:hypothetical protein
MPFLGRAIGHQSAHNGLKPPNFKNWDIIEEFWHPEIHFTYPENEFTQR